MDIVGKVVLVTGASSGIGEATAKLLTARGAKVALAARSADTLHTLAHEMPDSFVIPTDMTDLAAVARMVAATVEHYGRLDVLINNAGRGGGGPLANVAIDEVQELVALNIYGPLAAMQAAIPIMRGQGGGAIINIGSGTTKMVLPGVGIYSSTKLFLHQLSLTARAELAGEQIVVSIVHPYITETNFFKNATHRGSATAASAPSAQASGRPEMPPADPPEKVAHEILRAIETGEAEIVMLPGRPAAS